MPLAKTSPLKPAQMSIDSVTLEIFFVRFPFNDATLNGPLWSQVDEQQIPVEARRRLAANGFRAGLLGSTLPEALATLMKVETDQPQADQPAQDGSAAQAQVADLLAEPTVRRRRVQCRTGEPTRIVTTGEQARHDSLAVLTRTEEGEVLGRTFEKAMGLYSTRSYPQSDGRVRLELIPEVEHGEPRQRRSFSEGVLRVDFGPAREIFDPLKLDATLDAGQILIVGGLPDLPGSLGHQFFSDQSGGQKTQRLLLVRVAQTQHDDLFSLE